MEENGKKQVPLRLSASLWKELVGWAQEDFRSLNGQIEFLLTECVRMRKNAQRKNASLDDAPLDNAPLDNAPLDNAQFDEISADDPPQE